ncbi:putative transmembrane protein [Cavenderia fasciculata]|uniref:Transmembrane protein n=1 Tax=Cavenderia fasciculata TaxID=261658 RepID=F4PK97_CACFS|nr:putative transmembrane protein [Cavenderia fasciculata]EGG24021.1 putative transmembrane protein [Cavenderia fasciculata]|eukprot:XP_004361872.1 putative transmembrane protein [Cavenderia fasciculata]
MTEIDKIFGVTLEVGKCLGFKEEERYKYLSFVFRSMSLMTLFINRMLSPHRYVSHIYKNRDHIGNETTVYTDITAVHTASEWIFTLTYKKLNVLGTDLDIGYINVETDRPIFSHMDVVCPNFTCPNVVQPGGIDCTCDYSDPLDCPKSPSGSSCPPCPLTQILQNGTITTECNPGYNWTTVTIGKEYYFESTGSIIYLRLKANASICQGLRFYASQKLGNIRLYVNDNATNANRNVYSNALHLGLCPSDIGLSRGVWTNNTYFVSIKPESDKVAFSFIAYSAEVPKQVTQPPCPNTSMNHTCLPNGGSIQSNAVQQYYYMPINRTTKVAMRCPLLNENIQVFASPNVFYPSASAYGWSVYNFGGDAYLSMTTSSTIFVGILNFFKANYTCTFTTHTVPILRPITQNFPLGASYLFYGTSALKIKGEIFISSFYFFNFPRQSQNPLWPIPRSLKEEDKHISFFENIDYDQFAFDNPPKPNSFQSAIIIKKGSQVYLPLQSLLSAQLVLLGYLVDSDGNPLLNEALDLNVTTPECEYSELDSIKIQLDQLESQLFTASGFQEVSNIRFAIDILTAEDTWVGCQALADSLLETNTVNITANATKCQYSSLDNRYYTDPCCSPEQNYFQCCIPHLQEIPQTTYSGVQKSLVEDQCSSPDCTASILQDYFNATSTMASECELTYSSFSDYQLDIYTTLRNCRTAYDMIDCDNDTMCAPYICDYYTRQCQVPPEIQDNQFFNCVMNGLSPKVLYYLQSRYNIAYEINTPQFNQELFSNFVDNDCTSSTGGLLYRKYYKWITNSDVCYPATRCYDASCLTVSDVCYQLETGFSFVETDFVDLCPEIGVCSDQSCQHNTHNSTCHTDCLARPNFCGYCRNNNSVCYSIRQLDEAQCNATDTICAVSGQYGIGYTDEECKSIGICSSYCGYQCSGVYTGCVLPLVETQTDCSAQSGVWSASYSLCTRPDVTAIQTCQLITNAVWTNCSTKPVSECYANFGSMSICSVAPINCQNKQECENYGACSDEFYFNPINTPNYPVLYGKCVRGHDYYSGIMWQPSCNYPNEHDSPKGCFNSTPQVLTEQACLALGPEYKWWAATIGKDECLAQMGCKIIDQSPYNLPNNFRFNEMNQTACEACRVDQSYHEWTNMFTWKPNHWIPGIPIKPTWMKPQFQQLGFLKPVLDNMLFSNVLDEAYQTHISDLLRSSSLCRMERIEDSLHSISCSCGGPGGAQCFTSSSLVLGQSYPCSKEESEFKFSYGKIMFSNSSVPQACTNVVVSQLSKLLFKSSQTESLSSNFVSYKKVDSFAIYNDNDAAIGVLLTDGVKLHSPGVDLFTICYSSESVDLEHSSSYPILDIAVEIQEDETSSNPHHTSQSMVILNVNIFQTTDPITQESYYCSEIPSIAETATYFLVSRVEDYQDLEKELFDKEATGLLYTLAAIFLFNAAWGALQLIVSAFKIYKKLDEPRLIHALTISITIFMLIRAIYFFILPTKMISSVGDYILVVLPTFIYFTCFTIIIVIWYMLVKAYTGSFFKRIRLMITTINGVLYVLFIIIVLVFHFTQKEDNNGDCGGRIPLEPSTTTPQRVVSIVYAVVQAVISLIIGSAFAYLGLTLFFMVRNRKVALSEEKRGEQQKKVSMVTLVCSIGFMLHCVFVLVLVAAEPSNIVFTFVGLLITEIAPIFALLYAYKQGTLSSIKQVIGMKKLGSASSSTNSKTPSSG